MGAGLHRCGNLGWSLAAFATVVTACFGGAAPVVPREAAASQLSPLDVVVVGGAPCGIAASSGSLWVSDLEGDRVVRIDPQTRTAIESHAVGDAPCWIATTDAGELWVSPSAERFLQVVDPATGAVTDTVEIASGPADAKVTFAFGGVWATATPDGHVVEIDPASRRVVARIHVGTDPRSVVAGGGYLWVAVEGSDRVVAIDPATGRIVERHRAGAPSAILAATRRWVWVASLAAERVVRLDARTGEVERDFALAANPQPGAVVDGVVWSPDHLGDEILLFPRTGEVTRVPVGASPSGLTRYEGDLWVANYGDGTVSVVDPRQ